MNETSNAIKKFFNSEGITAKFKELLGKKAPGFITSILQLCNSNEKLAKCNPVEIYQCAAMAAMLDLPLNPNLGFAYIIPYNEKFIDTDPNTGKPMEVTRQVPQFQMGYRGFVQLAQRSGQLQTINVTDVREGEIEYNNRLTGDIKFKWDETPDRDKKAIVGFVGYFKLINGFEKTVYKTKAELLAHGERYSKTFKQKSGKWNTDFDAMAAKTLIKLMLNKYAPLSTEMQMAIVADQAAIKGLEEGFENAEFVYVDNDGTQEEVSLEDLQLLFDMKKAALTKDELASAERIISNKEINSYNKLHEVLKGK